ncbi:transposase [Nocardioides sp. DS6]|uniref:Transposase n=1 Tax=Nocardioides eburneus TaxID=3231482 RepID=A0ABV3SV36_9ACTN
MTPTTRSSSRGCAQQQLRSAYNAQSPAEGRPTAQKVLVSLTPACPIPEIKRLGKTPKHWREAPLAYFDTGRANKGGTQAINGLIELHRRVARSFRNHELPTRMLLVGGGLSNLTSSRKSLIEVADRAVR